MTVRICNDCKRDFDPAESLMGEEGQCQDCWEHECDRSWWAFMKRLDEALGPVREADISHPIPDNVRREMALFFQAAGRRPCASTNIADQLSRGYGQLDEYGFWEYQL